MGMPHQGTRPMNDPADHRFTTDEQSEQHRLSSPGQVIMTPAGPMVLALVPAHWTSEVVWRGGFAWEHNLTKVHIKILEFWCEGRKDIEIWPHFSSDKKKYDFLRTEILQKLGVKNRTAASAIAARFGIGNNS